MVGGSTSCFTRGLSAHCTPQVAKVKSSADWDSALRMLGFCSESSGCFAVGGLLSADFDTRGSIKPGHYLLAKWVELDSFKECSDCRQNAEEAAKNGINFQFPLLGNLHSRPLAATIKTSFHLLQISIDSDCFLTKFGDSQGIG